MSYRYKTGQVCMNGHIITGDLQSGDASDYCDRCGEPTTIRCCNCDVALRGDCFDTAWESQFPMQSAPAFCYACGTPFPWTDRAVKAAQDLADEVEGIDDAEREKAKSSFIALASDTPQTLVAATRVKKLFDKAAPAVKDGLRQVLVSVATDAAKRLIGL